MVRKPRPPLVEVANPPKETSNRHFGPVSQVNIPTLAGLAIVGGTYAVAVATDVAVLGAAGAGLRHYIYACGYTVDAAVRTGFRFNSADPRFCPRRTAGVYAQTFPHPNPVPSPVNGTLTLRVEGASNGDYYILYRTVAP